jgi:hypothetical protein
MGAPGDIRADQARDIQRLQMRLEQHKDYDHKRSGADRRPSSWHAVLVKRSGAADVCFAIVRQAVYNPICINCRLRLGTNTICI